MNKALQRLAAEREVGLVVLIGLTVLTVSVKNPGFLMPGNLVDILVQCAPVVMVACGVMLVVVSGEIDISVGSLMGLLAAFLAIFTSADYLALSPLLGIPLVLGAGALIGLGTGLLVTVAQVPSIIVTLGLLTALRGFAIMAVHGQDIKGLPDALRRIGLSDGGTLALAAAVIALTAVICKATPLGRRIYALGSNPHSAELAGLSARNLKLFAFAYTGLLTALATLLRVGKLGNVS